MKVYIRCKGTEINSHLVRYAIQWFAHMLMSAQLCKNLEIRIIHRLFDEKAKILAESDFNDDMDNPNYRRFSIWINPTLPYHIYMTSLAHEMVHVKQWATGELRGSLRWPHLTKWKDEYIEEQSQNYYEYPWEIDAYGRSVGLYRRFRNHIKKNKLTFDEKVKFDHRKVLDERRIRTKPSND